MLVESKVKRQEEGERLDDGYRSDEVQDKKKESD